MRATVEVLQATAGSSDTNLALCVDSRNFYMISVESGQLRFEQVLSGSRSTVSVAFDVAQQRFWRIRHEPSNDSIIFETSSDGQTWTLRRTVTRQLQITSLRAEISAGTWEALSAPGMAVFDNFRLESNNQLPPLLSPSLVANAQQSALVLAALQNPDSGGILSLVMDIEQAYKTFSNEYSRFSRVTDIERNLRCALDSANSARVAPRTLVRKRLLTTSQYLTDALTIMLSNGARGSEANRTRSVARVKTESPPRPLYSDPTLVRYSRGSRL
jgi:hypothetical protein